MLHEHTCQVLPTHTLQCRIATPKFEDINVQSLWPFAFVFGSEHLFRGGLMGVLPVALLSNYSAGMHAVPVMKWVLQWVDLKPSGHYSVFLLLGTRDEWQRIAAALAAWHGDRKRGGPADQAQNHRQQTDHPSRVRAYLGVRRNGELHFKAQ